MKASQINGIFAIAGYMIAAGGNPTTTLLPNLNHNEVEGMYKLATGVFDWLFAQQKTPAQTPVDQIINKDISMMLFPNPTNGEVTVRMHSPYSGYYVISNELGQTLVFEQVREKSEFKINLQHINSGMYFLIMISGNGMKTQSILIKQ